MFGMLTWTFPVGKGCNIYKPSNFESGMSVRFFFECSMKANIQITCSASHWQFGVNDTENLKQSYQSGFHFDIISTLFPALAMFAYQKIPENTLPKVTIDNHSNGKSPFSYVQYKIPYIFNWWIFHCQLSFAWSRLPSVARTNGCTHHNDIQVFTTPQEV